MIARKIPVKQQQSLTLPMEEEKMTVLIDRIFFAIVKMIIPKQCLARLKTAKS